MTDPRLDSLLLRWEELRDAGRSVRPEELCADCPELVAPLREHIAALRGLDWLADNALPVGASLRADDSVVPGYRLVRRLGRGGFGEVWEAAGPGGVAVAVKVLPLETAAAAHELRALNRLRDVRHPHLLPVFGVWETGGSLVIAMELGEQTLADRCRAAGGTGLPAADLHRWMAEAATGLDYLHGPGSGPGIQHRDVKPANLLLVGDSVKVADFGLARALEHSVTGHTGGLTVAFAAPEFFDGRTSRHSDQYSLAVSYCLLRGGRLPFAGSTARIVAGHLRGRPDLGMLPAAERRVVSRALKKDPALRWPTCTAFVEALRKPPRPPLLTRRQALTAGAVGAGGLTWWLWPRTITLYREMGAGEDIYRCAIGADAVGLITSNGPKTGPRLWDMHTGRLLREFDQVGGPSIALKPYGGEWVAAGGENGELTQWSTENGRVLVRYESDAKSVTSIVVSRSGDRMLSTNSDGKARLWDTKNGKELTRFTGHSNFVMCAAYAKNETQALTGGMDGVLRLWDFETGTQLREFQGHNNEIWSVAVSEDGTVALSASKDGTARLWKIATGTELHRFTGHERKWVMGATFLDSLNLCVTGGFDGRVRLWDRDSYAEVARTPAIEAVHSVNWAGSRFLVSASDAVRVWRVNLR